jgi:hypothetical protein
MNYGSEFMFILRLSHNREASNVETQHSPINKSQKALEESIISSITKSKPGGYYQFTILGPGNAHQTKQHKQQTDTDNPVITTGKEHRKIIKIVSHVKGGLVNRGVLIC